MKQTEKVTPLIMGEITFVQHVWQLVFGVNIFDLDLWVQIDSFKLPIQRNSVGPGHVFRRMTSALTDHLDHCLSVFKMHS